MLSRKIKIEINQLKENNLKRRFTQLESLPINLQALESTKQAKQSGGYFREGNQTTNDGSEIAEKFASNLAEIFERVSLLRQSWNPNSEAHPPDIRPKPPEQPEISISLTELKQAINSCKSTAAPGTDQITNLMPKSSPPHILSVILYLFNASLKNGHLQTNWKHSKIIMIAKKNMPKDSFSSYRPISANIMG